MSLGFVYEAAMGAFYFRKRIFENFWISHSKNIYQRWQENRNFCLIVSRKVMLKNMYWTHCAPICTLYVLVSWVRSFDTELSSKLIDSCLYVRLWTSHISSEFFCAWLFVSLRAVVLHTYLHLVKLLSGENFNEQVQTAVDYGSTGRGVFKRGVQN